MKTLLFALLFFFSASAYAQITIEPKLSRKASNDTYIKKVEINESHTIIHMQYKSMTAKEGLKEFLDSNPEQKDKLAEMDPMMRDLILQQMMRGINGSTISIQPSTFLRSQDGRKYEFVKAKNIPVAPERLQVEQEEEYDFQIYFEKLDPGVKKFDFIEGESDERDGFQYWNFYEIQITNPADGEVLSENENQEIIISGKIYDSVTKKTISAKIICRLAKNNEVIDEMQTSKTGYFEFSIKPDDYVYIITATAYQQKEEMYGLSGLKNSQSFVQNFYLTPDREVLEEMFSREENSSSEDLIEKIDEKTYRLKHVYFPTGRAEILSNSYRELDKVVEMMEQKPNMKIRVDGHTDNQGDSGLNQILSLDRAKNVRDYLINNGISADRINYKGWGDTKPLETNVDETLRQKNRRVEIVILEND